MMNLLPRRFKLLDWGLIALVFLILIFGLAIQYGLSLSFQATGLPNFIKQIIFIIIGCVLMVLVSQIDFRDIKPLAYFLYIFVLALLLLVLFLGKTFHGVKGWITFGLFDFQLVELVKLVSIIALAAFWQQNVRPLPFTKIIISLFFVLPAIILVYLQPDLGSALVLLGIWLGMVLLVDKKMKHFIIIFLLIALTVVMFYFFVLQDYQRARILTYFNQNADPLGRGYQIKQAIVAVGSGKFFGRGLAFGTQSQLKFLPASQTDFIFAVIAEETGLFGCLIILILFFLFLSRLNRIAQTTYDNFGALIVIGILINFFIHFVVNIGMNLGLVPIIGIPLPFLSYGGSFLVMSLVAIGLIESIIVHRVQTIPENNAFNL